MKKSYLLIMLALLANVLTPVLGQETNKKQTDLSGWMLPKGKDIAWQMKFQMKAVDAQEPDNDRNGNSWKDLSYDDSSWETLTGPLGRESSDTINSNYSWEGDYKAFYLRRAFNLTSIPSDDVVLHLFQDDAVEIYINGNLVTEVRSHRTKWSTYPINPNVFVKGRNILAIKFATETVPDYLDYGIYGGTPEEYDGKLYLSTSKTDLSEGDMFELTVTANPAPDTPTTLMLTCDKSMRFDFPSRLTLPAGESTVKTTVTVINDNDIADTQSAAFTVSGENYESGEALVMVNDDDMPHIELVLAPTTVSAYAGPNAIMGTIRRSDHLNSKLTVVLSDDGNDLLSYSSQQVTLERGATEAHFTISPKGNISSDREVNITAAVYIKTCNCPAGAQSGGSTTQSLTLLAGEGSDMTIKPLTTDFSSDSDQNGIIITIESPAQHDVVINVTSDFDDYLDYTHTVTMPAGETSVTVPIGRKGATYLPAGQVVTFKATADGYATATCWAIATENSLPDAIISSFEVSAAEAEAGSEVNLTIVVKNNGRGQLGEDTPLKVTLSDGSYPVVLKTGTALSSGESTTISTSYQLPLLTGDYNFQAIVNPAGKLEEAVTTNNMSQEIPITIKPNYQVTAKADKATYGQGEVITVTGTATGAKSAFADVEVYFINDDMRQTINAKTDANGNYSALFLPIDGTSGHFVIGACFPGEGKTEAMAEANVFGLKLQSHHTTCQLGQGGSYNGTVTVSNTGNLAQTGIRVEQQDSPEGCVFSFPVINRIEAGETLDVAYTINSAGNNGTDGVKRMIVSIKSNEGALTEHTIDYSIEPVQGSLKTDSISFAMTMTLKDGEERTREFPITIWNEGMAPTGAITLSLPKWIESVTPQQLPSLASGDSVTVILRVITKDMYLNMTKKGRIGMNCADGTGLSINIEVTPVSEQNGTFTIDVLDEFTYCTEEKPHVSGAKVQVVNKSTQEVVAEGVTNAEGKFTANIPEGWYRLKVTADYHESYDEYLLVDPGTNKTKRVFISFNGITTEWKVDETNVEDDYSMETVLKFETQVPPPYIDVIWPKEKPQLGKYYPVTIVNRGLIEFLDVKVNLNISSTKYGLEVIGNPEIDTLAAGQAVVLYTKLIFKNNPNLARGVGVEETQESGFNDCEELIADLKACYICGEPIEKLFKLIKSLGRCIQNYYSENGSGTGGSGTIGEDSSGGDENAPEEPEEIACDLPKFKIVTVYGDNVVRGVATDGESQVKIVLDGEYNESKNSGITWGNWEIEGGDNVGYIIQLGKSPLEGVIYTAPYNFPNDNTSTYNVKIKLKFTKIGKQNPEYITVAVELIRVPVMMLQDCESDASFWEPYKKELYSRNIRNLFKPALYNKFQFFPNILFKKGTWSYGTNWYKALGKQMSKKVKDFLHKIEKDNQYVASKVDYIGHGMAGLIQMDKQLIHKYITLNTPHGGTQWAHFMASKYALFVKYIEDDKKNGIIAPFPNERRRFCDYHNSYYGDNPADFSGAFVGMQGDKNHPIMSDVNCHAITTTKGTTDPTFHFINYKGSIDFRIFGFMGETDLNIYETPFKQANDEMFGGKCNDWIVSKASQSGGLEYPQSHNIHNCGHLESGSDSDVLEHITTLLKAKVYDEWFANGFSSITPKLEYTMDGLMDAQMFGLKFYNSGNCSNYNYLMEHYLPNRKESSNSAKLRKMGEGNSIITNHNSINLSYQYNDGDTLMTIKIDTLGTFNYLSFDCIYNKEVFSTVNSQEGIIKLPEKIKGEIIVNYEGENSDGIWFYETDTIAVNTIGNATMQELSFAEDSLLIFDDVFIYPSVQCTWSDGTVTEVENPTLSVTNGNLAYIEDNKYVYGKNSGHTNLVATYGGLTCSTPLEVYFTDDDTNGINDGNNGGNSSKSVCSTVTLSLKNKSVMTRQGFRGMLTINNNHPSLPLQNLRLHLEARDEDGNLATQHEFQINPESLNGDFTGELDFDTGWDLKSGGTGVATVLFIPTKYAAPSEPKLWSFGGTISYTDPFTGLVVTHSLKPVALTVNPTPVLDFTYFMQRDVYADDPQTTAKERSIPAEFALLINNKGNADAKDLKFVCKEPVIIDNEKKLKINFSIVSSQLNGEGKNLTLSSGVPMEFGTVQASSQAYAQWWMKSPVLGHFIEYDVSFDHKTSYGNEELSLIDQVSIHELIHGFTPLATEQNDSKRAFLVNDTEDALDMPDRIYFTNATQLEATMASEATISRQNGAYLFSVIPSQQGWTYAQIVNPAINGNVQVARIIRQSDQAEIPADNIWLTEMTLPDGAVGHPERKLHFIGDVPEGGEQFLIEFSYLADEELKVDKYEGVPADDVELGTALKEITIRFTKPINEETFSVDDLTLYREGTKVDISATTIAKIDEQTFTLNLGTATSQEGYYVLMVNTQNITDSEGYDGVLSDEASWIQKEYEEPSVTIDVTDISQLTDATYITPFTAHSGDDVEIAICLKNEQTATAYMFDLVLPKGITVATNNAGKYIDVMSDRHDDHSRLINYRGDNTYALSSFSGNSEELTGNDGAIRLLTLHIDKDMAEGMYAVNIRNASYSKPNGALVKLPDTTSSITVEHYVWGDVNRDGHLDVSDAEAIVNYLMGIKNSTFVEKLADTNNDGLINVADVVTIFKHLNGE